MTPEQVSEIERLLEKLSDEPWPDEPMFVESGVWASSGPIYECPHGGVFHKGAEAQACEEVTYGPAMADQNFMRAMRNYAGPIVKALRSYAQDRAGWDEAAEKMDQMMRGLVEARSAAWKERDEARAELTRIRNAIMEAGVSEPVQANLPFLLIDIGSWKRIRAVALSDVPEPSPTVSE